MIAPGQRLVIHGAGRMGQLVAGLAQEEGFSVAALVSRQHPGALGGLTWRPGLDALDVTPGVVIDFSLPSGALAAARWCAAHGVPLVSGTTGLEEQEQRALAEASKTVPVLHAANFSPGVNAMLGVLKTLRGLGLGLRAAKLVDVHHVHKKDAPSGTALALAEALGSIPTDIESRREGDVIGDHAVTLELEGEHLTIAHHAERRDIFARGALRAARWLMVQPAGLYTASDWVMAATKSP